MTAPHRWGDRIKALFGRSADPRHTLVESTPAIRSIAELTRTQQLFVEWNAERLGITPAASRARYAASWAAFRDGHGGRPFRKFNEKAHEVFGVFFSDREQEVFETYRFHGPMHFLTMLTYPEPAWSEAHVIVSALRARPEVTILDFGCGLAQQSRTLAEYLRGRGQAVRLVLVDIPTLRREFLLWAGEHTGIPTAFLGCSADAPIPPLPRVDVCIATEFFEHVHDPARYFAHIDAALNDGGLLVTEISDHYAGFMHVSPSLEVLRGAVASRGFEAIVPRRIYRKRGATAVG
jgi:SAM-dependent methyltransferase